MEAFEGHTPRIRGKSRRRAHSSEVRHRGFQASLAPAHRSVAMWLAVRRRTRCIGRAHRCRMPSGERASRSALRRRGNAPFPPAERFLEPLPKRPPRSDRCSRDGQQLGRVFAATAALSTLAFALEQIESKTSRQQAIPAVGDALRLPFRPRERSPFAAAHRRSDVPAGAT